MKDWKHKLWLQLIMNKREKCIFQREGIAIRVKYDTQGWWWWWWESSGTLGQRLEDGIDGVNDAVRRHHVGDDDVGAAGGGLNRHTVVVPEGKRADIKDWRQYFS